MTSYDAGTGIDGLVWVCVFWIVAAFAVGAAWGFVWGRQERRK